MNKRYLLLLIFLPVICRSQETGEDEIPWNASRLLTWNDYKGQPNENSDAAASTSTFLGVEYSLNSKGFTYKIQCSFSKSHSWARAKTDFILQHEQGHFDIAEIFARKLNKQLKEYRFDKTSYREDFENIYHGITAAKEKFQDLYDSETDHSRKAQQQQEWLKKIKTMLEELKDYAGY